MLPTPISYSSKRRRSIVAPRRPSLSILTARARVTNLAVVLLASFAALSFLYNLSFYFFPGAHLPASCHHPYSLINTVFRNKAVRDLSHLVIVPGHAIWKGTHSDLRFDDDEWILEPYQRGGGRVAAFYQHILRGWVYSVT